MESESEKNVAQIKEKPVKFEYIKIVKQTTSSVILEWLYDAEDDPEIVFKIVSLKNRNDWETVCWSNKQTCTIKNLEQNTCYSIKILAMKPAPDKYDVIDSSDIFKVEN